MKQNVGAVTQSNGRFHRTTPVGNTMPEKQKDWTLKQKEENFHTQHLILPLSLFNWATQTYNPSYFSLLLCSSWRPMADERIETNWNKTTWQASDKPSLLIPVYSKWKPAADTLMSDWKVKYRLLDVLFSSWGIDVPGLHSMQKAIYSMSGPYQRFKLLKGLWSWTTHEQTFHLS